MSEDTTAHGAILIDPPIDWTSVACPAAWLAIPRSEGPWRDALLRVVETQEPTAGGILVRRTLDAIVPANLIGHHLLAHVQQIVDHLGEGRTFTGHLECAYAGGEDVWRIAVRDGRAVEIRPTWPDETDRYVLATGAGAQAILLGPHGQVLVTADSAGYAEPEWQRLYRRIPAGQ
jgi:hypothetical protein